MPKEKVRFGGTVKGKGGIGFFVAFQHISVANNWKKNLIKQLKDAGFEVSESRGYYNGGK